MPLLYEEESYAILGACFEVYKEKGNGFLEAVYQECLSLEFEFRDIPYAAKSSLSLDYKGRPLTTAYIPDFVCFGKVIVELKSVNDLHEVFRAQVHNYLKATGYRLGFIINFGGYPKLEYERIVR